MQIDIIFLFLLLVYGTFVADGLYSSVVPIYFFILILAGTIISIRFMVVMAICVLVALVGFYVIEIIGYLPPTPSRDLPFRLTIFSGLAIVITVVLAFYRRVLNQTEQQRLALQTTAERLQVQQQLTQDLAHDLKTPITVLGTSLYIIQRKQEMGQDVTEPYQRLEENIRKLQNMVEGFTELSDLDTMLEQNSELLKTINLGNLIIEVVEDQQSYADKHEVELTLNLAENIFVMAQSSPLARVFHNLISNAILYGKKWAISHRDIEPSRFICRCND